MGDIHINSFSKGMNQDKAKTLRQNDSYFSADNFRPVTSEGSSAGVLENIKGNLSLVDIQDTTNFSIINIENLIFPYSGTFDVDALSVAVTGTNARSLLIDIKAQLDGAGIYISAFSGSRLVFYNPNAPHAGTALTAGTPPSVISITGIAAQTNLIVIGYAIMREDIILFTTNATGDDPVVPIEGVGQIWRLKYDKDNQSILNTETFGSPGPELLYNGELKFTSEHPIEAVGRFETPDIQRIYWTDNFNNVRTVNTQDDTLISLNPLNLSIVPAVRLTRPIIAEITSGNLTSGTYIYSYRLKKTGGVQTEFSVTSNPINIVPDGETAPWKSYDGGDEDGGVATSKGIKLIIDDLDTDFDIIEIVVFYRKNGTSGYAGALLIEDNISGKIIYDIFTHTGTEVTSIAITLEEFIIASQSTISKAKTINTKDNRLFLGNITEGTFDVPDIDTRIFRYRSGAGTGTVNDGVSTPLRPDSIPAGGGFNATDYLDSNEEADNINPYNADKTRSELSEDHHKWKLNGTTMGGDGANISFNFITRNIEFDKLDYPAGGNPYVDVDKNAPSTINVNNINYNLGELWENYKNPYFSSLFKGYQRSEVYRFGLVFFNKQGNASFVKWMADIRMPDTFDEDDKNNIAQGQSYDGYDFTEENPGVGNIYNGKALGLNFDIDLSDLVSLGIADEIGGFSVVRVPRDISNRTIVGQGMIGEIASLKGSHRHQGLSNGDEDFHFNIDRYGDANDHMSRTWVGNTDGGGPDVESITTFFGPPFAWINTNGSVVASALNNVSVFSNGGTGTVDDFGVLLEFHDGSGIGQRFVDSLHNIVRFDCPQFLFEGDANLNIADYELKFLNMKRNKDGIQNYGKVLDSNNGTDDQLTNDTPHLLYNKFYQQEYSVDNLGARQNTLKVSKILSVVQGDTFNMSLMGGSSLLYIPNAAASPGPYGKVISAFGVPVASAPYEDRYYNASRPTGRSKATGATTQENRFCSVGDATMMIRIEGAPDPNYGPAGQASDMHEIFTNTGKDPRTTVGGRKGFANLYRPVEKQYGGNTFSRRSGGKYITCGHYYAIDGPNDPILSGPVSQEVWGGDTYVNLFDHAGHFGNFGDHSGTDIRFEAIGTAPSTLNLYAVLWGAHETGSVAIYPVESTTNLDLRDGTHFAINGVGSTNAEGSSSPVDDIYIEDLKHNFAFSQDNDLIEYFSKSITFKTQTVFDNRIISSEIKINGELVDNWTRFLSNNFMDVEGSYGPINKLIILKDKMYAIQDNAFVRINVNPRVAVTGQEGAELELGTGAVLHDFDYMSTVYGSLHQWGVISSNNSIYFFDASKKKMVKFQGEGTQSISDVFGLSALLGDISGDLLNGADNPLTGIGINGVYDYRFHDVIFTFHNGGDSFTIAYNEMLNAFSSFYSFHPKLYIQDHDNFITPNPTDGSKLYVHDKGDYNNFYGTVFPSKIDIEANPKAPITKVFDNVAFHLEVTDESNPGTKINLDETLSSIRFHNDFQSSGFVTPDQTPVTGNIRRKEREWQMAVLRNAVDEALANPDILDPANLDLNRQFKERLRDKYLTINMIFDNPNNRKILLHYLKTFYRLSAR